VRTFKLALCAALVLPVCGCYQRLVADDQIRPGVIDTVLARTEKARGIRAHERVDVEVVTSAELGGTVMRALLRPWKDDELARYESSLVTIGLWPPEKQLLTEMAGTLGKEAAGLYIPEDRKLYVVSDPVVPWSVKVVSAIARRDLVREYALAHEIVHFLQHESHPALFAALMTVKDSDDAVWAAQAAIEGDAVRYGFEALGAASAAPAPADFQSQLEKAVEKGSFANEPRFIRDGMLFPYGYGYRLSALEATLLLERPPASTEQALHLDKRHEPFTIFVLPEAGVHAADCMPQWENSVGELGISMLLREIDPATDPRAWSGWDGDRYATFECRGKRAFTWLTSWDSEYDAQQFADAYRTIAPALAQRASLGAEPRIVMKRNEVMIFTPDVSTYADAALAGAKRDRAATLEEALAASTTVASTTEAARVSAAAPTR
jgi:hypothetical protein